MSGRIWIERPIESVEDAEALPEGALILLPGEEDHPLTWYPDKGLALDVDSWWCATPGRDDMYALVPVEAEEETSRAWRPGDQPEVTEEFTLCPDGPLLDWIDALPQRSRLVTPWEDA